MTINVVNVLVDIIQVEPRVNYAIRFMHHVQNVQQQQRHVPHVPQDIMSQEEVVLNVPIQ